MTEPKFETVQEFLKRGGTITKIPSGPVAPLSDSVIGAPKRRYEHYDMEEESLFEKQPNIKLVDYYNRRRQR